MAKITQAMVVTAKEKAHQGVDYSPRLGASCPWCNKRTKIYKTMPWEDRIRIRYHRCQNTRCVVNQLGLAVKSIEVDTVEVVE